MNIFDITKDSILKAISEYDDIGHEKFLEKYEFGRINIRFYIKIGNKRYPSKAIVGAAYGYEFPEKDSLKHSDFSGGKDTVQKLLKRLKFDMEINESSSRRNWSHQEIRLIIQDYFSMLERELQGVSYNKTEHRNELMMKLKGRNDASIEFKHSNISAILKLTDLPFIDGYKPLKNYQELLEIEVLKYLDKTGLKLIEKISESLPNQFFDIDLGNILDTPPDFPELNTTTPSSFHGRRTDFIKKAKRDKEIGKKGEEFVFNMEKQYLIKHKRSDLAQNVKWDAKDKGDGLGYDILSYDLNNNVKYIEVKTTNYGKLTNFYITRNEILFSEINKENYYLYRIYNFNKSTKFYQLKGSLMKTLNLVPETYKASPY